MTHSFPTRRASDRAGPVQVVGETESGLRQATNAEELIGDLPGVSPGASSAVNNGGAGFASLNLRGVGTNRNLVLLDGTRLVPSSLLSETDLNIIPDRKSTRLNSSP